MNFSRNILENIFKYFEYHKDIEKFENINNNLNYKLRLIYKTHIHATSYTSGLIRMLNPLNGICYST